MTVYAARYGWVDGRLESDLRISVQHGRIAAVSSAPAQPGDEMLPGVVLPGVANTHSHAFHRALRGRTSAGRGSFWTWREAMYALAARLTAPAYFALARAVYAEMALAGISCVGEFHYLRDGIGGGNEMAEALVAAAAEAGIRITLIDACYLTGGIGQPLRPEQARFDDGSVERWAARVAQLPTLDHARVGVAVHSVRAVARADIASVVAAADGRPLHVHLSEQPAENEQCAAAYGCSPTELLEQAGALGPATTAVHATHLSDTDIALLGNAGVAISVCPTTERDLADGIGPARRLADAGCRLTLGSDQHAVIDPFEEARALEMDQRLATGSRGNFRPAELVAALSGHDTLGWPDAGQLRPGARADLVAVRLDTVRTAGADPAQALLTAGASDVDTVIVDGRVVVRGGRHVLGDVAALLTEAIDAVHS